MERKLNEPVEIASGIYWVGYSNEKYGFHSNPYLIVEGDEAILIDGGSRPDFSTVMMKVLKTGIKPSQIKALIYHHYDPDLCGSIPHVEKLINSKDLYIISHHLNNMFIQHYSQTITKRCITTMDYTYQFKTGRQLQFIQTPYAHSPGSFVTYDVETKTLFSSDLFGSYDYHWNMYLDYKENCEGCDDYDACITGTECYMKGILDFHKDIMPSTKALRVALERIDHLSLNRICPQHGSIIEGKHVCEGMKKKLRRIEGVGIDHIKEGSL